MGHQYYHILILIAVEHADHIFGSVDPHLTAALFLKPFFAERGPPVLFMAWSRNLSQLLQQQNGLLLMLFDKTVDPLPLHPISSMILTL